MKSHNAIVFVGIIGTILAVSGMVHQEAFATDVDEIMSKIIKIDRNISNLKSIDDADFNKSTLGKASFEINQIEKSLLEINELNDKNGDEVNKIYEYIKNEYNSTIEKYQKEVKAYEKENGLTVEEKKLVGKIFKNQITFKNNESEQGLKIIQQELINTAIKKSEAKENYQKLVNKIGIKLADEANGGKVQKIHHKIAIKEIVSSKTWDIAIPAVDRIITQTNNEEFKGKLVEIKNNIKEVLDKKEKQNKQNQVLTLKNDKIDKGIKLVEFTPNEIIFDGVIDQIHDDEITSLLTNSEEILYEFEESNTLKIIEAIFEEELTQSLEEITEVISEDDKQIEEKIKKQKKNPITSDKRSDKAKNVLNQKQSSGNNGNGNGNNGNGNGNNGNGNGKSK